MELTQLTSSDLQKIAKLLQQKEELQAGIANINRQLTDFGAGEGEAPTPAKKTGRGRSPGPKSATPAQEAPSKRPRKGQKAGRGQLKERVVAALQQAGSQKDRTR